VSGHRGPDRLGSFRDSHRDANRRKNIRRPERVSCRGSLREGAALARNAAPDLNPSLNNQGEANMSASELEQRIAQLEDIEAIKKLKASYCLHVDHANEEGWVSLFT
jgi:hypothetical protein